MQELRLVAVSEDGTYVVLAQPGRATRFSLPNDERLRAVVRGQFSRLAQYEIEVESPLRPKEIQARIRAGETVEQIADTAGVPIERVRWFEGPVLAERAYMAQQAQTASVRRPGESGPGPRLGEIVTERLRSLGADPDDAAWDSRKRSDGSWLVELTCETGAEQLTASWLFDPRRRHAIPEEDEAARLSLPEDVLEAAGLALEPDPPARGGGTVTPFVPRSTALRRDPEPERPASDRDTEPAYSPAGRRPAGFSAAHTPAPGGTHPAVTTPPPQFPPTARPQAPAAAAGPGSASRPLAPRHPSREPEPAPEQPAAAQPPAAQPPAAQPPAAQPPAAQPPAAQQQAVGEAVGASQPAAPQAGQETPARGRSGRKAAGGRGRRASVPTWDEIMFGSSRRTD
jgi:Protein of unknown function (DUF3071)